MTAARYRTPRDVADIYGNSVETVLHWIASGELRAINTARKLGTRPRWKIAPTDLDAFERRRAAVPVAAPPAKRGRKRDPGVIQFF